MDCENDNKPNSEIADNGFASSEQEVIGELSAKEQKLKNAVEKYESKAGETPVPTWNFYREILGFLCLWALGYESIVLAVVLTVVTFIVSIPFHLICLVLVTPFYSIVWRKNKKLYAEYKAELEKVQAELRKLSGNLLDK